MKWEIRKSETTYDNQVLYERGIYLVPYQG